MNNGTSKLEQEIQVAILLVYQKAAIENNRKFFIENGFSDKTMKEIKNLPLSALHRIAGSNLFSVNCSESALNSRLRSGIAKEREHELIVEAIKLGASRMTLQAFTNLPNNKYRLIRSELGLGEEPRSKPQQISSHVLDAISITHNNFKMTEKRLYQSLPALEVLVRLAAAHNIEINRLYIYYYKDHADLFEKERNFDTAK